jgi:hypothetical protein
MAGDMRFGIYCEMQNRFGVDYAKTIRDVLSLIENADQLGYDVFSVIDHHFFQEFALAFLEVPYPARPNRGPAKGG